MASQSAQAWAKGLEAPRTPGHPRSEGRAPVGRARGNSSRRAPPHFAHASKSARRRGVLLRQCVRADVCLVNCVVHVGSAAGASAHSCLCVAASRAFAQSAARRIAASPPPSLAAAAVEGRPELLLQRLDVVQQVVGAAVKQDVPA